MTKIPMSLGVHLALEKDLQSEWVSFVLTTIEEDAFFPEKFCKAKVKNFAKNQLIELAKFWFDMNADSDFVFPKHGAPSASYIQDEWFMGIMVRATRGKLFGIDRPDSGEELSEEERGLRMRVSKKRSRLDDDDDDDNDDGYDDGDDDNDDRMVDESGDHECEFAKTTAETVPTKSDEGTKGNRPDLVSADAAATNYSQMWKSKVRKGIKAKFIRQMA